MTDASPLNVNPRSVEGVFLTALGKATPEERQKFLDETCGADTEQRRRVEALLRAYDDAGSFLERPPVAAPADPDRLDFLRPCSTPGRLGMLGSYEIIDVIGRGGMGIVLRAFDPKLSRVVAIKVLSPTLAVDANSRRRFVREAQAAAAISHPHVVTIHAVDEDQLPYLVMECIVGQSLQEKLDKSGALPLKETLRIGRQIAEGLAAAHAQGLIHRDIKPANILLENGVERVKITDFGLARGMGDSAITRTGEISGTPQYMSPEQARGEPIDQRSDLFSLGAVLYALCTGRPPFRSDHLAGVIRQVCDESPPPMRDLNSEIPEWLISVVERLLAKRPDGRFNSANEVAQLLNDQLANVQAPRGIWGRRRTAETIASSQVGSDSAVIQPVRQIAERLSQWHLRSALVTAVTLLVTWCVLALFPPEAGNGVGQFFLATTQFCLWAAAIQGWAGWQFRRLEHGREAIIKGWIASIAGLFGPGWMVSLPTAFATGSFLRRRETVAAYLDAANHDDVGGRRVLAPTQQAVSLGIVGGAILTMGWNLFLGNVGRPPRGDQFLVAVMLGSSAIAVSGLFAAKLLIGSLSRFVLLVALSMISAAGLFALLEDLPLEGIHRPGVAMVIAVLTLGTGFILFWMCRSGTDQSPIGPSTTFAAARQPSSPWRLTGWLVNFVLIAMLLSPLMLVGVWFSYQQLQSQQVSRPTTTEPPHLHFPQDPEPVAATAVANSTQPQPTGALVAHFDDRGNRMTALVIRAEPADMSGMPAAGSMAPMMSGGADMMMMGGTGMLGAFGSASGFRVIGNRSSGFQPPSQTESIELAPGDYHIIAIDHHVGWNNPALPASLNGAVGTGDDAAMSSMGASMPGMASSMMMGSGGFPGGGNLQNVGTYPVARITIHSGEVTAVTIRRDWKQIAAGKPDFSRSMLYRWFWNAEQYLLSRQQARIVQELIVRRADSIEPVPETVLLTAADSDAKSVHAVFNDGKHPAWGQVLAEFLPGGVVGLVNVPKTDAPQIESPVDPGTLPRNIPSASNLEPLPPSAPGTNPVLSDPFRLDNPAKPVDDSPPIPEPRSAAPESQPSADSSEIRPT